MVKTKTEILVPSADWGGEVTTGGRALSCGGTQVHQPYGPEAEPRY